MGAKLSDWVGEEFILEVNADSPKGGLTAGMGPAVKRERGDLAKVTLAVP